MGKFHGDMYEHVGGNRMTKEALASDASGTDGPVHDVSTCSHSSASAERLRTGDGRRQEVKWKI